MKKFDLFISLVSGMVPWLLVWTALSYSLGSYLVRVVIEVTPYVMNLTVPSNMMMLGIALYTVIQVILIKLSMYLLHKDEKIIRELWMEFRGKEVIG